jgi:tetratricopeptide (TPR) repeat protein
MKIKPKKFAILVGFLMGLVSTVNADTGKGCAMNLLDIENRFNNLLLSSDADRVDQALVLLGDAEKCQKTVEDKALVADLFGEICRLTYIYSRKASAFDCALNAFSKAAALNTARNEKIYWHMAQLMRNAGRYEDAIQSLNKVLNMTPEPKNPLPYLATGFQLSVDTQQWNDAKGLMEELSRRDQRFYAQPDLLLSSVVTLCHFNQLGDAKIIVKNVEENVVLDDAGKKLLQQSKEVIRNCKS